jgi:hypothetical protein
MFNICHLFFFITLLLLISVFVLIFLDCNSSINTVLNELEKNYQESVQTDTSNIISIPEQVRASVDGFLKQDSNHNAYRGATPLSITHAERLKHYNYLTEIAEAKDRQIEKEEKERRANRVQ